MKKLICKFTGIMLSMAIFSSLFVVAAQSTASEIEVSEHDLLKREIEAGQRVLESARARLVGMLSQTDQLNSQGSNINAEQILTREALLALDAEINSKRDELANTQRQISRIKSIQSARQKELQGLNAELVALKERKKTDATLLANASKDSEDRAATLQELDRKLQAETKEVQSLRDEIAKMNLDVEATREAAAKAKQSQTQEANKASSLSLNLAQIEATEAEIRATHETTKQQLSTDKAKLKEVLDSIAQADADKGQLTKDGDKIQQELLQLETATQGYDLELSNTSKQLTRAQNLLTAKQGEVANLKTQVQGLEKQQLLNETTVNSASSEVEQRKKRKLELAKELQLAKDEAKKLQGMLAAKETELGRINTAASDAALTKRAQQQELDNLQASLSASQESSSELSSRLNTLNQQLNEQSTKLETTRAEIASVQNQTKQIQAVLASGSKEAAIDLETPKVLAQLREVEAELVKQENMLQAETLVFDKAQAESRKRQSALSALEQGNFEIWEKIGWTKLRLEQSEKELLRERKKTQKSTDKLAKLEAELSNQKEVAARLKEQHEVQLQRKAEIDAEMSKLQSSLNDRNFREQEIVSQRKKLSKEAKVVKKKIANLKKQLRSDERALVSLRNN